MTPQSTLHYVVVGFLFIVFLIITLAVLRNYALI